MLKCPEAHEFAKAQREWWKKFKSQHQLPPAPKWPSSRG